VRPIVANAAVEPIEVLPIPAAGRPADYRGAVGKYLIATEANPTNVKAGDPINLLIGISGNGPMDLVQAPPLAELPELTADFKVPNEPLAGFVKGDRKVFSTTIRPRKEGITQVPAIPFSYFDPAAKKFVTVHSDPISVHVDRADTLALDTVVHRDATSTAEKSGINGTEAAASPSLEIYLGDDVLKVESATDLSSRQIALFLSMPPLLVICLLLVRARRGLSALVGGVGTGERRCKKRIEKAASGAEVGQVLRSFAAKRLGMRDPSPSAATVVGVLRSSGYRELAVRCERIFHNCESETSNSFVDGSPTSEHLRHETLRVIDDLEAQSRKRRPKQSASSRKLLIQTTVRSAPTKTVTPAVIAGALLVLGNSAAAANVASKSLTQTVSQLNAQVTLTTEQQRALLAEATDEYNKAQDIAAKDSAEAKQAFADVAEKFELLVHSGVRNSQLLANLGNAYLQSGQTGRAIANYRRCLRIDPTNKATRTNLTYAEGLVTNATASTSASAVKSGFTSETLRDCALIANDWLSRFVRPRSMITIMLLAWFILWSAIAFRILGIRSPWKTTAIAAIVLFAISATSYAFSCQASNRNVGVVVANDVKLHEGDGPNFATVPQSQLREGETVELSKRRGDWLQIRTENGETGWLPTAAVEAI
jgi:hypothetical protein